MHPVTYIFLVAGFAAFTAYSFSIARRSRKNETKGENVMPGPYQVPVIGRIHDLPINFMWLKFKEWADMYGPIYGTSMLGTKFVIVSDEKIAEELLVKRAKIYSDRPAVPSLYDSKSTHGSMEYLPLMGKNKYWARQRKLTHAYLTQCTNAQYYGSMNYECKRWMYRLLTEPETFQFTLEDMASKVMCKLTWDDTSFSAYHIGSAWGLLTQMSPAGPITNVMTPLWKLPMFMNPWQKAERKRHDEQQDYWMEKFLQVRERMEKGEARFSLCKQFLETQEKSSISCDYEASCVIGMLALVGVFTVAGPLNYFLIAMVLHPEWQQKCQEEVDRVCGGRMPTIDDSPNLPILRACIKETMRWRPNVPTGVAHEVEADDFYRGYFIEKGTRILPLDWAFLRNPVKYPEPETYNPARWLEPSYPTYQEPLTQFPTIKGFTSFGWGQRTCLGQSLTQDELVVACGGLAWGFNLKKKVDAATGQEIDIDTKKSNSLLIIKPDAFQMAFEPRTEAKRLQMLEQWRVAEELETKESEEFLAKARAARR